MDQQNSIPWGAKSNILRVKIRDTSANDGSGKTGLVFNSTGLLISTICDNEATPTVYSTTGATIETVTTLGTFAAPTATKCRFKLVDDTNNPGLYEVQFADARFAVVGARRLTITLSGVTDMEQTDVQIDLTGPNNLVNGASGEVLLNTTVATYTDQTHFTLTAGPAENTGIPPGATVVIRDSADPTKIATGILETYVGSTKSVVLFADPGFTFGVADNVTVLSSALNNLDGATLEIRGNTFKGLATISLP